MVKVPSDFYSFIPFSEVSPFLLLRVLLPYCMPSQPSFDLSFSNSLSYEEDRTVLYVKSLKKTLLAIKHTFSCAGSERAK